MILKTLQSMRKIFGKIWDFVIFRMLIIGIDVSISG